MLLIEDTGKGDGVKAPAPENGEGLIAGRFALLHLGSAAAIAKDPEKQKLLKQKEDLEQQIDELKYQQGVDGAAASIGSSCRRCWWIWRRRRRSSTNEATVPPHPSAFSVARRSLPACGASAPANAAEALQCEALQNHGDPGATACYQKLTSSPDPAMQAEGFWGLRRLSERQRCVPRAVESSRQGPQAASSLGAACSWSIGSRPMPRTCSRKRWRSTRTTREALLGLALVARESFEGKAIGVRREGAEERSEAVSKRRN